MRRLGAIVLLLLAALGCSAAPSTKASSPSGIVVLKPTVSGAALPAGVLVERSSVPPSDLANAGVAWGSVWGRGGSVLFFKDATFCLRDGLPVGAPAIAPGDNDDDPDEALLRIDMQGAEVSALERGVELNRSVVWLLVGSNEAEGSGGVARARELERRIVDRGLARRVQVARVDGLPGGEVRVVILENGDVASITDWLPAAVRGPPVSEVPRDVERLLEGPGPISQHVYDWVGVNVWIGDERRGWPAPPENYTAADKTWSDAFLRITDAIRRGCVLVASPE